MIQVLMPLSTSTNFGLNVFHNFYFFIKTWKCWGILSVFQIRHPILYKLCTYACTSFQEGQLRSLFILHVMLRRLLSWQGILIHSQWATLPSQLFANGRTSPFSTQSNLSKQSPIRSEVKQKGYIFNMFVPFYSVSLCQTRLLPILFSSHTDTCIKFEQFTRPNLVTYGHCKLCVSVGNQVSWMFS